MSNDKVTIGDIKELVSHTRSVMSSDNKFDRAIVMLGQFCIDLDSRIQGAVQRQDNLSERMDGISDRITNESEDLSGRIRRTSTDVDNLEREMRSLEGDVRHLERSR